MNNLLDVRKMEEGKMTLNNHPTNVKTVIKSVQDMLRPSVRKGVQFTCNFPAGTEVRNCDQRGAKRRAARSCL
ncbi:hypothetical protein TL16_g08271 [Triparma laevis f. inornata]|uniref:Uncharacterized protein n=1 Tax=Triparma laevis f. inornata TaxID=1714386 RepID=A0A9W7AWU2_9STRA|nr:hypothetical protein TL16_g08271 [Triparma laevis f. inornata]